MLSDQAGHSFVPCVMGFLVKEKLDAHESKYHMEDDEQDGNVSEDGEV